MRKVFLLYQNEMGKTVRKVSILVAMILMFVFIGGCAMTFKGIETVSYPFREDYGIIAERYKEDAERSASEALKSRATLDTLDPAADKAAYADYAYRYVCNLEDQKRCELMQSLYEAAARSAVRRNFTYESVFEKMSDRINEVVRFDNDTVDSPETLAAAEQQLEAGAELLAGEIGQLEYTLKVSSFREMLDRRRELLETSGSSGDECELYKEVYGWMDAYADKADVSCADYILAQADNYVRNKLTLKREAEGLPVQYGRFYCEKLARDTALLEYALRRGTVVDDAKRSLSPVRNREIMNQLCNTGTFIVAAVIIMLAGSAISAEMNNGSIKSLIIAPVRRGKIFAAKVLMLLTVQTAMLLFDYIVSLLFCGMLFGFRNFGTVVYYAFGAAHGMPYLVAGLLSLLLDGLAIGLFAALALALSALTHNTAVSVTLPLLGFFGGLLAELIMMLGGGRPYVAALLPVHNLANLHFVNGVPSIFRVFNEELDLQAAVGPLFSWIYVALLLTGLVWCARDAFCRKDIT